jgi:hypothetical protein
MEKRNVSETRITMMQMKMKEIKSILRRVISEARAARAAVAMIMATARVMQAATVLFLAMTSISMAGVTAS